MYGKLKKFIPNFGYKVSKRTEHLRHLDLDVDI
jgi:hypothetical protein